MKYALIILAIMVLFGSSMYISNALAQESPNRINVPVLSWEIKKGAGINCGGYYETDGTPQKCGVNYSDLDGLRITLDPDIENRRGEINTIVAKHDPDIKPADMPVPPTPVPTVSIKSRYGQAITDSERIDILAEAAGLK